MFRKLGLLSSYLLMATLLMSADRHLHTSADPHLQLIQLHLGSEVIDLYLNAPGVSYRKAHDGTLQSVSFEHVGTLYRVRFHENGMLYGREQPAQIQRFRVYDGEALLEGASETFGEDGTLLTQTYWNRGKLDGTQKIFDSKYQLREERMFAEGIPVGKWLFYYSDGTLASQVTFPPDLNSWKKSLVEGSQKESDKIWERPFYHPLLIKGVWFDRNGRKEREFQQFAHLTPTGFQVYPSHESKQFDDYGRLVHYQGQSKEGKKGCQVDTVIVDHLGMHEVRKSLLIDGKSFKNSRLSLPNGG